MKIVVDRDLCEANARCQEAAPQVFRDILSPLGRGP